MGRTQRGAGACAGPGPRGATASGSPLDLLGDLVQRQRADGLIALQVGLLVDRPLNVTDSERLHQRRVVVESDNPGLAVHLLHGPDRSHGDRCTECHVSGTAARAVDLKR